MTLVPAQSGNSGTTPTGAAGGDLSGNYPNPTVAKVNGLAPGGSWLTVQQAGASGVALGVTTTFTWTTPTGAGVDLAINGGDATKITVATAGWYILTAAVSIVNTAATLAEALCSQVGAVESARVGIGNAITEWDTMLSGGVVHLAAATQIQVNVVADNATSTGTYDVAGTPMTIVRIF